jgi:hypothetical protein
MNRFQAGMDQRFDEVNVRVGSLEAEVVKTNSDLTIIQQRMNKLEHNKLEAHMTIKGADASEVDAIVSLKCHRLAAIRFSTRSSLKAFL